MSDTIKRKWGFLRETSEQAIKAGIDKDTGLHRTGLDEYLKVIYPDVNDWIHDKIIGKTGGVVSRKRPDYRSDTLMMIIEFDGLQHYSSPSHIIRDKENTAFYESIGYKVVRIPYFIQLTNKAVERLFGIQVNEELFDESIPSLGPKGRNTPAFLCYSGIKRMAFDFAAFPEQYIVNIEFLKKQKEQFLVEYEILEREYCNLSANKVR